jgi:hypothetical protein
MLISGLRSVVSFCIVVEETISRKGGEIANLTGLVIFAHTVFPAVWAIKHDAAKANIINKTSDFFNG